MPNKLFKNNLSQHPNLLTIKLEIHIWNKLSQNNLFRHPNKTLDIWILCGCRDKTSNGIWSWRFSCLMQSSYLEFYSSKVLAFMIWQNSNFHLQGDLYLKIKYGIHFFIFNHTSHQPHTTYFLSESKEYTK